MEALHYTSETLSYAMSFRLLTQYSVLRSHNTTSVIFICLKLIEVKSLMSDNSHRRACKTALFLPSKALMMKAHSSDISTDG